METPHKASSTSTDSLSVNNMSADNMSANNLIANDLPISNQSNDVNTSNKSSVKALKLSYHRVNWKQSSNEILAIRHSVFIIERHYEENVLCDLDDKDCIHLIARNAEDHTIACARLNPNGRISKIAVQLSYRGEGIGSRILRELVIIGKKNKIKLVSLNAEIANKHLYDQQNFSAVGPVYMKQGIPHQMLACKLA